MSTQCLEGHSSSIYKDAHSLPGLQHLLELAIRTLGSVHLDLYKPTGTAGLVAGLSGSGGLDWTAWGEGTRLEGMYLGSCVWGFRYWGEMRWV